MRLCWAAEMARDETIRVVAKPRPGGRGEPSEPRSSHVPASTAKAQRQASPELCSRVSQLGRRVHSSHSSAGGSSLGLGSRDERPGQRAACPGHKVLNTAARSLWHHDACAQARSLDVHGKPGICLKPVLGGVVDITSAARCPRYQTTVGTRTLAGEGRGAPIDCLDNLRVLTCTCLMREHGWHSEVPNPGPWRILRPHAEPVTALGRGHISLRSPGVDHKETWSCERVQVKVDVRVGVSASADWTCQKLRSRRESECVHLINRRQRWDATDSDSPGAWVARPGLAALPLSDALN